MVTGDRLVEDVGYSMTKEGRKHLNEQTADWKRLSGAISAIVLPAQG
jgi:hypothetical protein